MDPLPSTAFPNSLRATAKASISRLLSLKTTLRMAVPLAAAGLLAGCISDGPNQTGGAYLAGHGIVLENPLYHVVIKGFPVDSFWTTELEPGHLGDSILLAGRSGAWYAEPRFAWNLSDTSMIDSLAEGDTIARTADTTLRLALTSPLMGHGAAGLKGLVSGAEGKVLDTARFAALSWVLNDSGISSDDWKDSINVWNRRFLFRGDSVIYAAGMAKIAPVTVTDTITLNIKDAYAAEGLQARGLPGLRKHLKKSPSRRHLVHMRLARLAGAGPDTGSSMLRLGGDWGSDGHAYIGPCLLFGTPRTAFSAVAKNRLITLDAGNRTRGVNYALRYDGPRTDMLNAKIRGLHVTFDRARFMDSLDAALRRQGVTPAPRGSDPLSLSYFVPFAKIILPIDTPTLQGRFPLPVNMISMIDTLLGDTINGGIGEITLREGETKDKIWTVSEVGRPETVRNHVGLRYKAIDSSLNQVILTWSKDTAANDTLYIRDGETRQWNFSGNSSKRTMNLMLAAGDDSLNVRSWLVVRRGLENNELRDAATGETIDELARKVPRFLKPGDQAIALRATGGIQALINRTNLGTTSLQDFQFEPAYRAVSDTARNSLGNLIGMEVPFPVLDVIPPKIDSVNGLAVDLDYYLYPLKAR